MGWDICGPIFDSEAVEKQGQEPMQTLTDYRRTNDHQLDAKAAAKSRENQGFVQVYDLGWRRLQSLMVSHPQAARLYALLAEHIDGMGAVVAAREVLAELLGVSTKTITRHAQTLEDAGALVRIQLAGGVYAYCLHPEEVWRSWDSKKDHAAFYTKTLVNKRTAGGEHIERKLRMMIRERAGEPELPLGDA